MYRIIPPRESSLDVIKAALKKQDEAVPTPWVAHRNCFYYGIAHTPMIFRLDYQIGERQQVTLLHRFRPVDDTPVFECLHRYNKDDRDKMNYTPNKTPNLLHLRKRQF